MKRIIVPVDFSVDSINALEHALIWANYLKTELCILHVQRNESLELPQDLLQEISTPVFVVDDAITYLIDKYKDRYQVESGKFYYEVREGRVYQEISHAAESERSLIMMGTHGVSGFEEYWMGSTAYRVVSKAKNPVVTIRFGCLAKIPKKIVLPIDISKQSREKIPLAMYLANTFNAHIHILGVGETRVKTVHETLRQYLHQVEDFFRERNTPFSSETVVGGNITDITIAYANSIEADLITIMTEQTERAENIWLGAYAQQMVNHSSIPVLSIHPNDPSFSHRI